MREIIYPAEPTFAAELAARPDEWDSPPIMSRAQEGGARRAACGTCSCRTGEWGAGLTNLEYAPIAEITGRSPHLAPEAMNCAAPDTGNMELLAMFGTAEQQERWLRPLLDGEIRSCFSMTEPEVASSDANNIATRIERDGDDYVVTGRKWWSSGAMNPRCRLSIVMGVSDPDGPRHRRHSMILVPHGHPGRDRGPSDDRVRLLRPVPTAATPRSSSTACGYQPPTCSAVSTRGSRSPRPGSARAGSITACGSSAWPSGRWT